MALRFSATALLVVSLITVARCGPLDADPAATNASSTVAVLRADEVLAAPDVHLRLPSESGEAGIPSEEEAAIAITEPDPEQLFPSDYGDEQLTKESSSLGDDNGGKEEDEETIHHRGSSEGKKKKKHHAVGKHEEGKEYKKAKKHHGVVGGGEDAATEKPKKRAHHCRHAEKEKNKMKKRMHHGHHHHDGNDSDDDEDDFGVMKWFKGIMNRF